MGLIAEGKIYGSYLLGLRGLRQDYFVTKMSWMVDTVQEIGTLVNKDSASKLTRISVASYGQLLHSENKNN